jgi:hypothetical protein
MRPGSILPALFTLALCGCAPMDYSKRVDLLGDPAPVSAATRVIVITPATRYVNVTGGDIVKFVVGDKAFAWNFDGEEYAGAFDLNLTAPAGLLDHPVMAYVEPNPLYSGDGGGRGGHGGHGGGHGGHGR